MYDYDSRASNGSRRDPYFNPNTYDGDNSDDRRSQSQNWLERDKERYSDEMERRPRRVAIHPPEWEDRESHRMRRNGHYSTQDFENENALRYNRGREGDQELRYREYSPRMYREDFGPNVNYGERYGFSGYGRSKYDPDINRGWQEDSEVQSWREKQPFTNREQDYRGGRWSRASHEYERAKPIEFQEGNQDRNSRKGSYTGVGPKNYRRTDSRIEEDVCERLMEHPEIDASNIEVKVKDGEVTLSGTVNDRNTKRMAEDVLDSLTGVRDINNQIRIGKSSGDQPQELSGSPSRTNGHTSEKHVKA